MAYSNNYRSGYSNGGGYSKSGYSRGGGNYSHGGGGNYSRVGGNYSRGPRKKTSGCKVKRNYVAKSGEKKDVVVSGWLKTRNGIISYVGSSAASKYQTTDNIKLSVKVTQGVQSQLYWGTFNPVTSMVYIQGINICGMPSKNSSFFRKG